MFNSNNIYKYIIKERKGDNKVVMKLDDKELALQRNRILTEIYELIDHLDVLSKHLKYVHSLKKGPGVFFRIKDIMYVLMPENANICSVAAIMHIDDLKSVIFKPLDNNSISYYKSKEGKLEALNRFKEFIIKDMSVVLHELVHIDDERKGIYRPDEKSIDNDPYKYYNHPAEIRAYTQQCLFIAQNEICNAIENGEIKNEKDLREFCEIYKEYKNIYTKLKKKNNFVYWKRSVFKDYLKNLDAIIDSMVYVLETIKIKKDILT